MAASNARWNTSSLIGGTSVRWEGSLGFMMGGGVGVLSMRGVGWGWLSEGKSAAAQGGNARKAAPNGLLQRVCPSDRGADFETEADLQRYLRVSSGCCALSSGKKRGGALRRSAYLTQDASSLGE